MANFITLLLAARLRMSEQLKQLHEKIVNLTFYYGYQREQT
ncbi:hypothetical protein AL08_04555 [Corynebacterium diphtheriae bv. gravis str. ISS 4746]|nr:hypothetical protein AL08_04555 [Corynebacterium diphtheriae bv. gravis str. ISS 4746]KLN44605.1 hypothetical protein AL09_04640 [Corynebacterium diphtheriae bv. gravis str. ISS 4749]